MKIKLLKSVLIGNATVTPTLANTVVNVEDNEARELVAAGLAEFDAPPENQRAGAPRPGVTDNAPTIPPADPHPVIRGGPPLFSSTAPGSVDADGSAGAKPGAPDKPALGIQPPR